MALFNPFAQMATNAMSRLQSSPFGGLLGIGQNAAPPAQPVTQPAVPQTGPVQGVGSGFQMTPLPTDRAQLPQQLYQYGLQLGWNPAQTASILGNIKQESEFNSKALNPGEGANGMIQWRMDRFDNLQKYASGMGKSWQDPFVQMSFIKHEMDTSEAPNASLFKRASDIDTANAGLKRYIRYGDDSQGTRRNNAATYYKQFAGLDAGPPVDLAAQAQNLSPLDRVMAAARGQMPQVALQAGASPQTEGQPQQPQSVIERALAAAKSGPTSQMKGPPKLSPAELPPDQGSNAAQVAQRKAQLAQSAVEGSRQPSQKAIQRKMGLRQRIGLGERKA